MTENEQKIINKISDLSGDYKCYDNRISHEESLVLDRLLSENQQYREIGTVEECEKAMDFELAKQDKMLAEVIDDYLKYIKIGTIEEFKDLKEKSEPKKIKYEEYCGFSDPVCPECKRDIDSEDKYCVGSEGRVGMERINLCKEVLENAIGVYKNSAKCFDEGLTPLEMVSVQAMEELLEHRQRKGN